MFQRKFCESCFTECAERVGLGAQGSLICLPDKQGGPPDGLAYKQGGSVLSTAFPSSHGLAIEGIPFNYEAASKSQIYDRSLRHLQTSSV